VSLFTRCANLELEVYLSWDTGPHMYNQGARFETNDLYDFTCGKSAPIGNEDFWNKAQAAYTPTSERPHGPGTP
jgi:hypothetical protein